MKISSIILPSFFLISSVFAEKKLFDCKSLKGWEGDPKFWSVQDGAILGQTTKENPTKGNTFLIWKDGKLSDFELTLDYKIEAFSCYFVLIPFTFFDRFSNLSGIAKLLRIFF